MSDDSFCRIASGEVAGQEVGHAHMHVIPRHGGDGFGWKRRGAMAERPALEATAEALRRALAGA